MVRQAPHPVHPGRQQTYDIKLLFAVLLLVGAGVVMVYSASSALALKRYGSDTYFLKRQGVFAFLGVVCLVVCSHIPFRLYQALAYPILTITLASLAATQINGLGIVAGGSRRWLDVRFFSFQPSELARLALVIFLAYSLNKKQDLVRRFSVGFVPHMLVLLLFTALLLLQPDFGAVVILGVLTWMMLFVGGVPLRHLLISLLPLLPVGWWLLMGAEYRVKRLLSFLDPWQYPNGEGYQAVHSLMAFGSGGILGAGIGRGYQKLFYLPESHTDFIFSVIGEELGLLGITIILVLYGIILWRGMVIARQSQNNFGTLMAIGLTAAIGLQVCINMGVALGLLPTKGLTLPFLSYGGTSLLLNMAAVGILMNIGAYHA